MDIKRRDIIKEYINDVGEVRVKELEAMFPDVSGMTIRRDLAYLEEKGYIIRTRGGAKSIKSLPGIMEEVYSIREMVNIEAKEKIAEKAVSFIETGRSIFIDSGTTMMCLAKILPDENLFILTSGPNVGMEILKKNKPSVTLIGGHLSRNTISASGVNSLEFIKNINIDIAFLATSGFSLKNGFTLGNFDECQLKKEIIKKARKKILLMDDSKINKDMIFTFAELKDIDVLISNSSLPENIIREAEKKGVILY